jgi:hypothetical protein
METDTKNLRQGEANRRKIRFPKICMYADLLHVSRNHLFKVLTGERTSPTLLARYETIRRSRAQRETTATPLPGKN